MTSSFPLLQLLNMDTIKRKIQQYIKMDYGKRFKIFNKVKCMHFYQIHKLNNHIVRIQNDTEIPITYQHKFLGITLDSKLSFIPPYQTTEDQMQPNHPNPESYSLHWLECWQKDPNLIIQIPNTIKAWLWLFHIQSSQKVLSWYHPPPGLDITLGAFTTSLIKPVWK